MFTNETQTDIWVYNLAQDAGITLHPQGSNIRTIVDSLKTASKKLTGKRGAPDYEFMENYIKGLKWDSIMRTIDFLN